MVENDEIDIKEVIIIIHEDTCAVFKAKNEAYSVIDNNGCIELNDKIIELLDDEELSYVYQNRLPLNDICSSKYEIKNIDEHSSYFI